mmetsp:Transcript_29734/g.41849  ORF Transcript_29734/g.41849 Transcript_29734/m.41849 type:complete len:421 (-) Transcript_29734:26-1288(-)
MADAIRKSPRKPKQVLLFAQEPEKEQHLRSPSKTQNSPAKRSPKKQSNAGKKIEGKGKYRKMIVQAITSLGRNSAHSYAAILKYVQSNFQHDQDEEKVKQFVKLALHRGPFIKDRASYRLPAKKKAARAPPKKAPAKKKTEDKEEEEEEEAEKEVVKKSPSPRKRKAAEEKKEEPEKKKRSPRKKAEEKTEEKEEESPKKKRTPRKKAEEKEEESPKKKRTPKKKKEEEKNEDENGNNSNNNNNKSPKKRTPKKKPAEKDKEVVVADVLPDVTTTGIVFNTTDLPEVRADIKQTIDSLLTDDNVRVGIVANRGWKDAAYNLELLEFTEDAKKIQDFVENSFGEGRDWLAYYKQVLQECVNFGWGVNKTKTLILIGDEGVNAVRDPSLQTEIGKLTQLGVRVFAFHHSQLFLLPSVLANLD